jgi:phosphoglycerate dehydrogenase-like enzyme
MAIKALVPMNLLSELSDGLAGLDVNLVPYDQEGRPRQDSPDAEILFLYWLTPQQTDQLLGTHPQLQWVHTGSAGVDHVITPAMLRSKVMLTKSAGVHARSIAEWSVLGILALEKGLARTLNQQRDHVWQKTERDELAGKRVVILGAGEIASEIATRLRPFGVQLVCVRRHTELHPLFDETYSTSQWHQAVRDADWLVIALPLTRETRGLVDEQFLRSLPAKCRLLNVARGEIVDQKALVEILTQRRIAGAVLDVFAEEPLPANHPLWSMPEVMVWPHTTAHSPQSKRRQIELFLDNLRRYARRQPLLNVVDLAAGY